MTEINQLGYIKYLTQVTVKRIFFWTVCYDSCGVLVWLLC